MFIQNFAEEFDIVTVTETHLDPNINNEELMIDSFSQNIFRKDRNNAGGGLLIYTKDDMSVTRKGVLENHIDETIWVEIRGKGQTFLLCCTYRSEWSGVEYYTRLIHAIELGYQYTENIVISEDLNSDLFSYNNNKLYDIIHQFNLKNVINKPTRVTDHSSTLLDPIILSDAIQFSFI